MYDVIGDIHGHADELICLLEVLGYDRARGVYRHPERTAVFLGDFIDRGPKIRQVLELARPMVEDGAAVAVLGNHELNALAYHTEDPAAPGAYLRRHTPKNQAQHRQTVEQLSPRDLADALAWFRTLPLWLDLGGIRAVHACWDDRALAQLADGLRVHGGITTSFLAAAYRPTGPLFAPVEVVLKGKEAELPAGTSFGDKDGHARTAIRTRWYLDPTGHTYATYALQSDPIVCELPLDPAVVAAAVPYPPTEKPVFVGHYWLAADRPALLAPNVACLDYSVAKGGFLCAYRWQGETVLRNDHFVRVAEPDVPICP